jgi:uncharacterized protein YkwD
VIGALEVSVFGAATPLSKIEDRLSKLETAVYKKSFAQETLFDRTERLKATLLGSQPEPAQNTASQFLDNSGQGAQNYFDSIAALAENQVEVPTEEMQRYFFSLINNERQKYGYGALAPDPIAQKIAQEQASDLASRRVLSHQDANGNNPDRRYTLAGGNDLVSESLVAIINDFNIAKHTRANVAKLVKALMNRQDDRDVILSGDATGLGFAVDWTKEKDKLLGCIEVVTRHGVIQPIPSTVPVGEKIELKGVVLAPFHFEKITVAWEDKNPSLSAAPPESDEALPYFAPLDYVAHAHHSDNDHQTAITVLKTAGIVAAIAGGVFVPPVALAAPIIAMSGTVSEPKPASDIPVKGGVKLDGNAFDAKVACNHEGKEGIYYLTIWASLTKYGKPIPISRRAILATTSSEDVQAKEISQSDAESNDGKAKSKAKKKHKPSS